MISFFEADLKSFAVHHVGNPLQDEHFSLSDELVALTDPVMNSLLMQYFLSPFQNTNMVYQLMHPSGDLDMNEVHSLARDVFENAEHFQDATERLARYLHSVSNHPKIKSGELYVCLFENIQIEGELLTALGIFKSENKESYLKASAAIGHYDMSYEQEAINITKLDKGCLIFNTQKEKGYKVAVIDNRPASGPGYWMDEFLQVEVRPDNYTKTADMLAICKNFVKHKLDDEFEMSESDKADILNRAVKYFKERDEFDIEEFAGEVIGNETAGESFKQYKEMYAAEYDLQVPDTFDISEAAVKKGARALKNVIKLDRNFKIEITGNKQLIERGYDNDKAMNYYKVYFKEETA